MWHRSHSSISKQQEDENKVGCILGHSYHYYHFKVVSDLQTILTPLFL
jgi:hypothetical protein